MKKEAQKSENTRVLIYSPHFAEYSLRLAIAHTDNLSVKLLCRRNNYTNEVDDNICVPASLPICLLPDKNWFYRVVSVPIACISAMVFRPHIVHIQEQPSIDSYLIARFLIWRWPTVLTVHDPSPHSGSDSENFAALKHRSDRVRASVQAFHVHGRYCALELAKHIDRRGRKILSTYHGPILSPKQSELRIACLTRLLLFGRMNRYKGVEQFVDLLDHLRKQFPTVKGVLAGTGPELRRLHEKIEKAGNVEVIDRYLSPSEARAEFQNASLIVLPYLDATQSGVVSAAFANGRPVAATAVGGLTDSVKDGIDGFIVPPTDQKVLIEKVREFLTDATYRNRLTQGAKRSGRIKLSWAKISDRLCILYAEILKNRRLERQ